MRTIVQREFLILAVSRIGDFCQKSSRGRIEHISGSDIRVPGCAAENGIGSGCANDRVIAKQRYRIAEKCRIIRLWIHKSAQ